MDSEIGDGGVTLLDSCRGKVNSFLSDWVNGLSGGGAVEPLPAILDTYLQGGKRLRPLLLMLSCAGFGGDAMSAGIVQAASSVEMYHNWTLIHDDILDHDALRRNRPTGHVIGRKSGEEQWHLSGDIAEDYGRSVAIMAGDLLHAMSISTMGSLPPEYSEVSPVLVTRMCSVLGKKIINGEQLDLRMSHMPFEQVNEVLVERMTEYKTGVLLEYCCMAGTALGLGSVSDHRVDTMGSFGNLLGMAFQYQDDLLGIFGDVAKLGKAIGADIREGKRTMLAVKTLAGLKGDARRRFLELYGRQEIALSDIEEIRALMRGSGAVAYVKKSADIMTRRALQNLAEVMPDNPARRQLQNIARELLTREV